MCESTGTIFNIQKFSLHDGPGIRTAVFFKGCPLRCRWCSNPESQSFRPEPVYDRGKCAACFACAGACSYGALEPADTVIVIDRNACTGCGSCVIACPNRALQMEGRCVTVSEIEKEVLKDLSFYEKSGGGVTFSGGEPLAQPEFLVALAARLKSLGLHTAMETTGFAAEAVFEAAIKDIDLLLFDIKHYDGLRHEEGTFVPNGGILRNLRHAVKSGKEVIARIPVIPGYNDSPHDAEEFVRLLKDAGITDVCLLPFHQFGEKKYELLGKAYDYKNRKSLHAEDVVGILEIFLAAGITAKTGG